MFSRLLLFFLLFCVKVSVAQDGILFIYAEASNVPYKFSFRNKLASAIQDSEYKLMLYVSNEKEPLVCTNVYETQSILEKVSMINTPKPNVLFDLDSINKIFSSDSVLSEVSQRATEIQERVQFYFFLNAADCRINKQDVHLAKALLLSNRLINRNGMLPNCRAKLFVQNLNTKADSMYFKNIEQEGLFEIESY